jgi:hypothetical protein
MALTALQLLTDCAVNQGKTWDATIAGGTSHLNEEQKFHLVTQVNAALRWWWKEHMRNFAWPETVSVDTSVDVTSGAITLSDLGEGSWAALFDADPRPDGNTARAIPFTRSGDKIHPRSSSGTGLATVFAFYRAACPQITYASGGTYASPSNIPNVCLRPVRDYTYGLQLEAAGHFDQAEKKLARAIGLFEDRVVDFKNGSRRLVWDVPEAGGIE